MPDDEGKYWSVGPRAFVDISEGKYTLDDYESYSDTLWDTTNSLGLPDGRCSAKLHGVNMECLCLKNKSSGHCTVQSVLEMGATKEAGYLQWKLEAERAERNNQPIPIGLDKIELVEIGGFVFDQEGTGFVPGLTLGGRTSRPCRKLMPRLLLSKINPELYSSIGSPQVMVNADCIVSAESFMLIYLLKDNPINFHPNMLLEEIFIQRINKFKSQWRDEWGLIVSQNPMRARDDELRKSTSESSDILFVFLTFTILVVYSVSFNFNIDMFKGKVYTAIAGVGAAIMGMVAGVGFVCYTDVAMVTTTLIVPFLSMGIGVDDMFVIINSYSLSYPIKDPKLRVKHTMQECGLSITITTLTNLIAFSIGSFSPYMSIKNFCLFSAGALGFGYAFALTITVAVLSLEAYRETELSMCCCFPIQELRDYCPPESPPAFGQSDTPANVVKRRVHKAFMEDPYWSARVTKQGLVPTDVSPTAPTSMNDTPLQLFHSGQWSTMNRLPHITEVNTTHLDRVEESPLCERNVNTPLNQVEYYNFGMDPPTEEAVMSNQQGASGLTLNASPLDDIETSSSPDLSTHFRDAGCHRTRPPSPLTAAVTDWTSPQTSATEVTAGPEGVMYRLPNLEEPTSSAFSPGILTGGDMRSSIDTGTWRSRRMSMSTEFNPREWNEIKNTVLSEPKGNVGRAFREFLLQQYALILLRPWMKVIVIVVFSGFAVISTYGLLHVEQGLDLEDLAPDSSYLKEFDDLSKKYFTEFDVPTSLFFKKDIPWHKQEVQDSLARLMAELHNIESLALIVDPLSRILNDQDYFTDNNRNDEDYFNMAIQSALEGSYSQFFADFLFEGDRVASWKATLFPKAMYTSQERAKFMIETRELLNAWTTSPYSIVANDKCTDDDKLCRDINQREFLTANNEFAAPNVNNVVPLHGYAWNYMMIFYESDLEITKAVAVSMTVAVVAMLFVTLLLLSEITMGLVVVLMLFLIDLNLFGFMYFWNVKLNMISMINLVISVGFAVDYAAHMCHTYTHCKSKTPDMKATEMLVLMGGAVFNGGSSTLIGILMLGFSTSFIFRVFFKLFLLVVVFGVSHGMILLPVVLTIVDTLVNAPNEKEKALHKQKLALMAADKVLIQSPGLQRAYSGPFSGAVMSPIGGGTVVAMSEDRG
eukprot:GHVH01006055.1.p1 GENE.GHVH01006055.1~~GHVH01006055.1.p1  ORF type:complete len:1155 (+),score=179.44 GHVH01006055.1:848-4312(+)